MRCPCREGCGIRRTSGDTKLQRGRRAEGAWPCADRQPAAPSVSADGAVLPQPPRCARAVRLQTDGTFLASSGTRTSLDVLTPTVLPTRAAAGNQGGNRFPPAMPLQRPLLRSVTHSLFRGKKKKCLRKSCPQSQSKP